MCSPVLSHGTSMGIAVNKIAAAKTSRFLLALMIATNLGLAPAARSRPLAPADVRASTSVDDISPGGPFTLTDDSARSVTLKTFLGRWHLIVFGYTGDPECSEALQKMAAAVRQLGAQPSVIGAILITVDPAQDTPEKLHRYLSGFSPRVIGLTGDTKQIQAVANRYQVTYTPGDPLHSGVDELSKTRFVYMVDPKGKVRAFLPEWVSTTHLTKTIRVAIGNSAGA